MQLKWIFYQNFLASHSIFVRFVRGAENGIICKWQVKWCDVFVHQLVWVYFASFVLHSPRLFWHWNELQISKFEFKFHLKIALVQVFPDGKTVIQLYNQYLRSNYDWVRFFKWMNKRYHHFSSQVDRSLKHFWADHILNAKLLNFFLPSKRQIAIGKFRPLYILFYDIAHKFSNISCNFFADLCTHTGRSYFVAIKWNT